MKRIHLLLFLGVGLWIGCTDSQTDFDATGTFEATEVTVSAEESGKLLEFRADEGQVFQAGEDVALIDTLQLSLQRQALLANKSALDQQRPDIRTQIAMLQQQLETAQKEKARVENLLKVNAANKKQLDDWNAQISLLNRQLDARKSDLTHHTASLNEQSSAVCIQVLQMEDRLNKCRVTSPISGTVLAKYAEQGEITSYGKPLFKIADTKNMFLRTYVTAAQLASLKLGQEVTLYADFGDEVYKSYPGKVVWISDQAEFTPKTILTDDERAVQVYAVKIAFQNDGGAKIGMYGKVKF